MQLLEFDEQVQRIFEDRRGTTERAFGIDQFGGTVSVTTNATIAWLIFASTTRTGPANKSICQKCLGFGSNNCWIERSTINPASRIAFQN